MPRHQMSALLCYFARVINQNSSHLPGTTGKKPSTIEDEVLIYFALFSDHLYLPLLGPSVIRSQTQVLCSIYCNPSSLVFEIIFLMTLALDFKLQEVRDLPSQLSPALSTVLRTGGRKERLSDGRPTAPRRVARRFCAE